MQFRTHLVPRIAGQVLFGIHIKLLQCVIKFSNRFFLVNPDVALQPFNNCARSSSHGVR